MVEDGVATCYGTQSLGIDTCHDKRTESCTWIFPTPACPSPLSPAIRVEPPSSRLGPTRPAPTRLGPTRPAPTRPAPTRPAPSAIPLPPTMPEPAPGGPPVSAGNNPLPIPSSCPFDEKTEAALNSCTEQEKCFSLSYEQLDDPDNLCDEPSCNFKWKVCIDLNQDNPCCTKTLKQAFQALCIRGNSSDECLNDDISFEPSDKISRARFGEKYCEIVRPGQNATFQLVSCVVGKTAAVMSEVDSTPMFPLVYINTHQLLLNCTVLLYNHLQKDGSTCEGGESGLFQANVTGINTLDGGMATCYGTRSFDLDSCFDYQDKDSCTWVFPTPACSNVSPLVDPAKTSPSPPGPMPAPPPSPSPPIPVVLPDPAAICPSEDKTQGPLNSCAEQEKCFSITYEELEDLENLCGDKPECNIKWKVCIEFNQDNPCCSKKQKQAVQSLCIRDNKSYSCLHDDISLDVVDEQTRIRFGESYCEIVQPGEMAIFQLVSVQGKEECCGDSVPSVSYRHVCVFNIVFCAATQIMYDFTERWSDM